MSGAADDVTVVWVAPAEGRDDAASALREWARARGVTLVPAAGGAAHAITIDLAVGERIEKELDRAREAIAALDADQAERALARAEAALRDHPELPQAAWLRAEVHRGWAARYSRVEPRDETRARTAWEEADALDGGRVAGVGETAAPPRKKAVTSLAVAGGGPRRVVARLDGVEIAGKPGADGATTFELDAAAAEHQIVVAIDDEPVFASWIAIADPGPDGARLTIPIDVGDSGVCSERTFARVARSTTEEGDRVIAPGVSCARWVAVVPGERKGSVLVSRCQGDACGPLLEWRAFGSFDVGTAGVEPPRKTPWPAWATWTMVGIGVTAIAITTIVASGVLESRPVEQRFVAGGVRVE